jgi:hypothetical protein
MLLNLLLINSNMYVEIVTRKFLYKNLFILYLHTHKLLDHHHLREQLTRREKNIYVSERFLLFGSRFN